MQISKATRQTFLGFFASHIAFSVLLDGQILLPPSVFPQAIRDVREFYVVTFADPLIRGPPFYPWFQSLVLFELIFQVPYFVVACKILSSSSQALFVTVPRWFRALSIIYGAHAATTLVPILGHILSNPTNTLSEKAILFGFYFPYFVFPASWVYILSQPEEKEDAESSKNNNTTAKKVE
jgi:hypothetical protein